MKEILTLFLTELFTLLAIFHKSKHINQIDLDMFSTPVLTKPEICIQDIDFFNNQLLVKNSYDILLSWRLESSSHKKRAFSRASMFS